MTEKLTKQVSEDSEIEAKIKEKGLDAPRITLDLIKSKVQNAAFHVFEDTQLTVCCLTLENGFTVTGESACASPENFDRDIGEEIAFNKAVNKVWDLEGYLLKQRLYEQGSNDE